MKGRFLPILQDSCLVKIYTASQYSFDCGFFVSMSELNVISEKSSPDTRDPLSKVIGLSKIAAMCILSTTSQP